MSETTQDLEALLLFTGVGFVLMLLEFKARQRWPKRTAAVALVALVAVMIWCRPVSPVLLWWHGFAAAFNGSILAKKES
jgi:hypothetical protein